MTEADLPQVRKLNNQFSDAVGDISLPKLKYLFGCAYSAYLVKDDSEVVAFYITHGEGLDYKSKNYTWHNSNYTNFVYVDRIVVATEYQNLKIGTMLYNHLERSLKGKV
jgi:predicted GNAT superfamily acetyltransferase